jgi:predicted alpha/beta-fold hydrolase
MNDTERLDWLSWLLDKIPAPVIQIRTSNDPFMVGLRIDTFDVDGDSLREAIDLARAAYDDTEDVE